MHTAPSSYWRHNHYCNDYCTVYCAMGQETTEDPKLFFFFLFIYGLFHISDIRLILQLSR